MANNRSINGFTRRVYLLLILSGCSITTFCQDFKPLKSPDVTSFIAVNYQPVNEYSGRADISIPLYSINFDGLEIPITVSYNTGGVNINGASSRVGLNWSLNTGGLISKEIVGDDDSFSSGSWNSETGKYVYSRFGFLRHLFPFENVYIDGSGPVPVEIISEYRDTRPDLYFVSAPDLTTKFAHRADGSVFEITKTGSIIETTFQGSIPLRSDLVFSAEITSSKGFVYAFDDREYNCVFPAERELETLTDDLVTTRWPVDISEEQIKAHLYGPSVQDYWPGSYRETSPAIHISSIKNPMTNKVVRFYYKDNFVVDNNRRIERNFTLSQGAASLISQVNYEHDFSREKLIHKIDFPEGVIDFYYEDRTDVVGGKRLHKIEIRNNYGNFVKGILFEQDYFITPDCSDPECLRLRLNAIKFFDENNEPLPGYTFTYNQTALPKRYSLNQDWSGLYNGNHGLLLKNYVPKIYYKANQGRNTYLPFPLPDEGYGLLVGTASLASDLQYATAGMLERLVYATGGYSVFQYELNSFNFLNREVSGGGLRISSQSIYDDNNALQRHVTYDYALDAGGTSGSILNVPRFVESFITDRVKQYATSKVEVTDGSFVGYSSCKLAEENNGYTLNRYTSPAEFPNIFPATHSYPPDSPPALQDLENRGLAPTVYQDMDIKRGKLLSTSIYNNQGSLVKNIDNEYAYQAYDELNLSQYVIYESTPGQYGTLNLFGTYDYKVASESYLLTKSVVTEATPKGNIRTENNFAYYVNVPFVREQNFVDGADVVKESFAYPFDGDVASLPNISSLLSSNILVPIKTRKWRNDLLVNTSLTEYGSFGNRIRPSAIFEAFGSNSLREVRRFVDYSGTGNLLEYSIKNGKHYSVLWGYGNNYKIAEIVGATYSEVLGALGVQNADYLQELTNASLSQELDKLRSGLPNAQVYTYLHEPLTGVILITDPRGKSTSYEYDTFGRATIAKDQFGNITSRNTYKFKLNPVLTISNLPLTLGLSKGPVSNYMDYAIGSGDPVITLFSSDLKGGRGDYSYEWTEVGSSTVLSRKSHLRRSIACGTSFVAQLRATDANGLTAIETITSNARSCSEAFYVEMYYNSVVQKMSALPEGGSYKFSYRWNKSATGTYPEVSETIYDTNVCPFTFVNPTSDPRTFTVTVTVTDTETGRVVQKSMQITIRGEFEPPSCFVSGTSILMADGCEKAIESLKVGDKILTYNIASNSIEVGRVEKVNSPVHNKMVQLTFTDGRINTNTFDHPYFVKDKGWASYDPSATRRNYSLDVQQLAVGDVVFAYNLNDKSIEEIKLTEAKEISKTVKTYNLEKVDKNHNFFANGILVHNKSSVD